MRGIRDLFNYLICSSYVCFFFSHSLVTDCQSLFFPLFSTILKFS